MEHKIVVPVLVTRSFVQAHRELVFVYGNDLQDKGILGAPWHLYGEPNTVSIPTARKLCFSSTDRFWQNGHFSLFKEKLDEIILRLLKETRPIIQLRKIGEGCSRLKETSPDCFAYMKQELSKIETPHVTDWHGNLL